MNGDGEGCTARPTSTITFLVVLLAACSTIRVPQVGEPGPTARDPAEEQRWQQVVARYSDRKAIYDGLDTRAFVAATWQAPELVEARVHRESEFLDLSPQDAALALEHERARLDAVTEVVIGVNFNEARYEDFDKPGSVWRLSLKAGDQQLPPLEIHRVGRANLARRAFYPYLDTFWVEYVARFPKAEGRPLTLKLASALGEAELNFGPP